MSDKSSAMKNNNKEVTLLDGGMGHELKLRGICDGTFVAGLLANEQLLHADTVESIHFDYLAAGCNVITTNSFVAVPQRMIECGLTSQNISANFRAAVLIRASVDRARAAVAKFDDATKDYGGDHSKKRPLIAGCIPPLTECYISEKVSASVDDLMSEYQIIVSTLLDCEVDILLAETLSTTREALAILRVLSLLRKTRPIWISFTIKDDVYTNLRSDESLEGACQSIIKEAVSLSIPLEAIGVNCSTPSAISNAMPILKKAVEGTSTKILAYGNCFQTTTSEWIEESSVEDNAKEKSDREKPINCCSHDYDKEGYMLPSAYAQYAKEWADSGATIIGGCCGSRPKQMKAVADIFKYQ